MKKQNWMRALILGAMLVGVSGCQQSAEHAAEREREATADVVADLAMASLAEAQAATPDKPKPGDKCATCSGTGRVGDGRVSQTCLACDGTGVVPDTAAQPPHITAAKPPQITAPKPQQATASKDWTRDTITVCHGTYCTRVPGKLHATRHWFYSTTGRYYRRHGNVWRPYKH